MGEQRMKWVGVGGRLTIRAQRAHFTHTSSKPMGFVLVAGKREKGGKRDFDFIWQPETPSHSHQQKKKEWEAWSVHCHKINTDTKSKEREIKRVKDVERSWAKKKKTGEERRAERRDGRPEVDLHPAGSLCRTDRRTLGAYLLASDVRRHLLVMYVAQRRCSQPDICAVSLLWGSPKLLNFEEDSRGSLEGAGLVSGTRVRLLLWQLTAPTTSRQRRNIKRADISASSKC